MKKIAVSLFSAIALCWLIAGCGEDNKKSPTAPPIRDAVEITIASADLTIATNPVPISVLRESDISIPTEGANQVWNYFRVGIKSSSNEEWASLPANPAFNGANTTYIDNYNILGFNVKVVEYFQKDAEWQQIVGSHIENTRINLDVSGSSFLEVPTQSVPYTPERKLLRFPMAYGDASVTFPTCTRLVTANITFAILGFNNTPIGYKVTFDRTNTVVGWGLLLLPGYSMAFDVLLVRSDIIETDTFYLNNELASQETLNLFGLTQNKVTPITEYSFYARNNPQPILLIQVKGGVVSYAQMLRQANNE